MSCHIRGGTFVFVLCILGFQTQQVHADEDLVVNLVLTPAVHMIDASWELQNATGDVTRYRVTWETTDGSTKECYVNSTSFSTLDCDTRPFLSSCTYYTVTVQPQKIKLPSQVDTGTPASDSTYTLPGDVPISNVICPSSNNLSITLTWGGPGECVQYSVSYNATVLWEYQEYLHDSLTTRHMTATFTDLVPYTRYVFTVGAEEIDGEASCNSTTPETEPSAPNDVTVYNTSATSAVIFWREPDEENGILANYQIQWSSEEGGGSDETQETSFVLTNLGPCSDYNVTVAASTSAGYGEYATPANFSTTVAVPPAVTSLEVTEELSRSITLSWTRPNTTCDIIKYTVVYEGVTLWGDLSAIANGSASLKEFNDTDTVEAELSGLIPYSNYSIYVLASTVAGDGSASEPTNAQTAEDVPTAPLNLEATTMNFSTIQLNWGPPEEENGIIEHYRVSWTLFNGTSEKEENEELLSGEQLSYDVPDLQECQIYLFSVAASTSAGEGPAASITRSATDEVLEAPVVNCKKQDNYVGVTWVAPETSCEITEFFVSTSVKVLWSGEELTYQAQVVESETEYGYDDPQPYSYYTFEVYASFSGYMVGESGKCSIQTDEAAPSAPENLVLLNATTSSLIIQWEQPAQLNGVLRSYLVSWRVNGTTDDKNETVLAQEGHSTYNYTISGLTASTSYSTQVQGTTVETGIASLAVYATDAAPSPQSSSVAGIVIGCIFGILLLVAIIVAFIKRDYIQEKYRAMRRGSSSRQNSRPSETNELQSSLLMGILNTIHQFENDTEKLTLAYEHLKARSPVDSTNEAERHHNMTKNRYFNILPFDRTRVKLRSDWSTSDYINASYVKDSRGIVRFIACQGPKDETVDDFWAMIWQEDVRIIVMLANCFEGGKPKCTRYWPQQRNATVLVDQKHLRLNDEYQEAGHIRRTLILEDESRREITQFHFTNWADFGVPASEDVLLSLVECVRAEAAPDAKVVVHCSAGVGRTGTFIALWNLQESYEQGKIIDVDETIIKIRKDRRDMVQSQDQYLYLFKCFAQYLQSPRTYAAGGISNKGYHNTENINRSPSYLSENTAGNRTSSSSALSHEYQNLQMSSFKPEASTPRVYDSGAISLPPRAPLPPDSPSPTLPPLRNNYVEALDAPQNYSQLAPIPPPRPQKPHAQPSVNNDSRRQSAYMENSRPSLPPRPKLNSLSARPSPGNSNPNSNIPPVQFHRYTDV